MPLKKNIYTVEVEYWMRVNLSVEAPSEKSARRLVGKKIEEGDFEYDGEIVEESEKIVGCELEEEG